MRSLQLVQFDLESAIASLKSGQPVIPVSLDQIHQPLIFTKRLCDIFDDELNEIARKVGSRAN